MNVEGSRFIHIKHLTNIVFAGMLYIGVKGSEMIDTCKFSISIEKNACPSGCNGHSTCNTETHECHQPCHEVRFIYSLLSAISTDQSMIQGSQRYY